MNQSGHLAATLVGQLCATSGQRYLSCLFGLEHFCSTSLTKIWIYRSAVTRQITSPTSSATSKEPSGPIVTPTGRP